MLQPRAQQVVHANGIQFEPTAQQVRLQLDKLIGDALGPDTDGDGVITAAEIRQEREGKPIKSSSDRSKTRCNSSR